jgi:hypothetical protein
MKISSLRLSRRTAAAVALLGSVAAALVALPSRGQQTPPTQQPTPVPEVPPVIQATVPATASDDGATRVDYEFTLPNGFELRRHPLLRALNAQGKQVALLPMYILRREPNWVGYRSLSTGRYKPGVYQVTVEVEFTRPDGTEGTAATSARTLTVR